MKKSNYIVLFLVVICSCVLNAQRKELRGQLIADDDVEGIHILNKTAAKYAISNEDGSFLIPAKAFDTLTISGLKYEIKEVIIIKSMVELGSFSVQLTEKINQLNQVVIGKLLTGSLESDLENSDAETEINFYDLGILGNVKKPLTQNEQKLHDADGQDWGAIGLGFSLNFHKLLNRVSGRTKKLREIVELDNRNKCITRLRREYAEIIFEKDSLAEHLKNEYFMFCEEDPAFELLCERNNDLKSIEFLKSKLIAYKENRKEFTKD
ncbi:peptidase associated/transthyretin-like domain-containing protein [Winogradskyella ursingii]|uniref:hypothetical protein n=1 Tax=Winogradskyella ursingii TaxID=2686079 RepID=UPI0015C92B77|nr:hypothetical protein [Winogradskyella ursingii]